jgi:hypothetical protein
MRPGCREWAPDHSRWEWLRGRGLPPTRRPGSASSLSVSAARRRLPSRTQSQVLNVAVLFNPISNFRLHFETAHSAFPSTRTLNKSGLKISKATKAHEIAVAALFEVFFFYALREGGTLTLSELSPAMQSLHPNPACLLCLKLVSCAMCRHLAPTPRFVTRKSTHQPTG